MPIEPYTSGVFEGEAVAEVRDINGAEPQTIIKDTDAFSVRVNLTFKGSMAPLTLTNSGNEWLIRAVVENIGPPAAGEKQIGADTKKDWVPFVTNPGPPATHTYTIDVPVPATDLSPGLYKLGVVITAQTKTIPPVAVGVVGFTEGNLFQITP